MQINHRAGIELRAKMNAMKKIRIFKTENLSGNMTLEAAIIVPVIMLIILMLVKTGVDLHNVNKDKSAEYINIIEESLNDPHQKRKSLYQYKLLEDEIDRVKE